MAGSTVKMGVDVTQFKQGMKEAQNSVKTLDAALKYNEKQMKASGNAEKDFATQANLLNAKLKEQKTIAANAEKALKEMEKNGVRTTSAAYQDMQRQLINAQSAILDTEAALNSLNTSQQEASQSAGELSQNVASIGKKMSLEQVQSGLKSVTGIIEKAATAAWDLGQKLVGSVKDAAKAADDAATMAEMYDIPLEKYLQMQALVESGGVETSVEAILAAMSKMRKGVGADSKAAMDALKELGVGMREGDILDPYSWKTKDPTKLFWEAGKAIMALGDAYEQENKAQAIFGKSWRDLKPLFDSFDNQEDYQKALEGTTVNSEDTIRNLAELNDKMMELEHNFGVVKTELLGALAPALTTVSGVLSDLLVEFNKYLQSPEGQKKMQELSDAVVELFSGLKDISAEDVVNTAKDIIDGIVTSLQWIAENYDKVVTGIELIIGAWAIAETAQGITTMMNLINGIRGLGIGGAASAGGAAAGSSWAAAFANAAWSFGPFAALAAIMGWGIYENNKNRDEIQEKYQKQAEQAEEAAKVTGNTNAAKKVRALMEGVGYQRNEDGSFKTAFLGNKLLGFNGAVENELLAMASMSELEKAKVFTAINQASAAGKYSHGNYTVDELMRYWETGGMGEDWDKARIDDLARAVSAALTEAETKNASRIQNGGGKTFSETLANEWEIWNKIRPEDRPKIPMQPVIEDQEAAAEKISEEIGTVPVLVEPVVSGSVPSSKIPNVGYWWGRRPYGGGSPAGANYIEGYANGIWSVPWDGYPAILHRGERVVPARAAGGTYSSNLYVENMNMNNGQDAEGLAARMAAAQRRTMSGYGS